MRRANKPILDVDGYASGFITRCELGQGVRSTRIAKDNVDQDPYDRYEMEIQTNGLTGPIKHTVFVGVILNPEPVSTTGRGKKTVATYNRLTTLCLSMGLLTQDELDDLSDKTVERVENDFLGLEGDSVRFKIGVTEKGARVPDVTTMQRIDAPETPEKTESPKAGMRKYKAAAPGEADKTATPKKRAYAKKADKPADV